MLLLSIQRQILKHLSRESYQFEPQINISVEIGGERWQIWNLSRLLAYGSVLNQYSLGHLQDQSYIFYGFLVLILLYETFFVSIWPKTLPIKEAVSATWSREQFVE